MTERAWLPIVPSAAEGCPIESPDGRNLYFMSSRNGGLDIWRGHWNALMHSWDNVTKNRAAGVFQAL